MHMKLKMVLAAMGFLLVIPAAWGSEPDFVQGENIFIETGVT